MLAPFDEAAVRFLDEQIDGEPLEVEVLHPRDMVEHRRIMAQIGDVAKALHRTHDQVRAELLYATGNFALVGELTGMPPAIAVNSMSRHSMTDRELHIFWNEAREVIETRLLPRVEDDAERTRLAELLSPQPA
ncbi:hypothetical protein J2R91_005294 [Bradyrhizobium japonicum]|nr:hypothetical protein [Bradyrhizobium japonicum]